MFIFLCVPPFAAVQTICVLTGIENFLHFRLEPASVEMLVRGKCDSSLNLHFWQPGVPGAMLAKNGQASESFDLRFGPLPNGWGFLGFEHTTGRWILNGVFLDLQRLMKQLNQAKIHFNGRRCGVH